MTTLAGLTKGRDLDGDVEYTTEDGYKVRGVTGRARWMVTGPRIPTVRYARHLIGAADVIDRARRGLFAP